MGISKRAKRWFAMTLLLLFLLVARLAQLQLFDTESFSSHHINLLKESVEQRTSGITISNGRGGFVDRNGEPLTHAEYPSLVLFPFLKEMDWPIDKVSEITGIPEVKLEEALKQHDEPFAFGYGEPVELTESQMDAINNLNIPGVFAIDKQFKVNEELASHLIGLIGENNEVLEKRYKEKLDSGEISLNTKIGVTGLQKVFDEFLLPQGEEKLLYHVDNRGEPLFGLNVKYTGSSNPYYPVKVKTTIDRDIQEAAEAIIEKHKIEKGGLVLLDVETSDILALVSRPSFGKKGGLTNQMVIPQTPGSVFKVVTATAALERRAAQDKRTFDCNQNLYGDGPAQRQLGALNFDDSFAQSCNYTFATLAGELIEQDHQTLETYAKKLGLLGPAGWKGNVFHFGDFAQLEEERQGVIWSGDSIRTEKNSAKAVAQTAIGQKNVRVSPLAVANMMATIARGGESRQVRAATKIMYRNESSLYQFPEQQMADSGLKQETAESMQNLLEKVVEEPEGTGHRFATLPYIPAGKSGTAELSRGRLNKWFAGYFPAKKPKYALVVVELGLDSGDDIKTYDIFAEMDQKLFEIDQQRE